MKKFILNDDNILLLILLNALLILILGYSDYSFLLILDNIFTLLFGLELYYKLKQTDFWKDRWNIFDFVIVTLSIPSLLWFINFDVSFLLALRTLRVFKTFRFFKFVPNINNLLKSINRVFKTAGFLLIGIAVYIFVRQHAKKANAHSGTFGFATPQSQTLKTKRA